MKIVECIIVAVIVSFLLALTGCAQWDVAQGVVADKGSQAADEVRETAEWTLCKGMTVGAWIRAYGSNAAKAQAWRELCSVVVLQTPGSLSSSRELPPMMLPPGEMTKPDPTLPPKQQGGTSYGIPKQPIPYGPGDGLPKQ